MDVYGVNQAWRSAIGVARVMDNGIYSERIWLSVFMVKNVIVMGRVVMVQMVTVGG